MNDRVLAARLVAQPGEAAAERFDRILINDLLLSCSIGVHDYEHHAPQRVRINVELQVRKAPAELHDDIGNVLSYEDILNGIKALAAEGHINLVETLAERIAELCLADERARSVRVRVEKLDIEPSAAGVGIEIERSQ